MLYSVCPKIFLHLQTLVCLWRCGKTWILSSKLLYLYQSKTATVPNASEYSMIVYTMPEIGICFPLLIGLLWIRNTFTIVKHIQVNIQDREGHYYTTIITHIICVAILRELRYGHHTINENCLQTWRNIFINENYGEEWVCYILKASGLSYINTDFSQCWKNHNDLLTYLTSFMDWIICKSMH